MICLPRPNGLAIGLCPFGAGGLAAILPHPRRAYALRFVMPPPLGTVEKWSAVLPARSGQRASGPLFLLLGGGPGSSERPAGNGTGRDARAGKQARRLRSIFQQPPGALDAQISPDAFTTTDWHGSTVKGTRSTVDWGKQAGSF